MIIVSPATHLTIASIDAHSCEVILKWRDRETGQCGRIDHLGEWSHDGKLSIPQEFEFQDTFGMSSAEYAQITKAHACDPDFDRIKKLAEEWDRDRYQPMTIRDAKKAVVEMFQDFPACQGVGLRGCEIIVLWIDDTYPVMPYFDQYPVSFVVMGEARPLWD